MNITRAEARNGMILASADDGWQISVFIDDRGQAHTGRECSVVIGETVVEYIMPLGPDGVLRLPMNMRIRSAGP